MQQETTNQQQQQVSTTTATANVDHTTIVANKVAQAMIGWKEKHPAATTEQIETQRKKIAENMLAKGQQTVSESLALERAARRQTVNNFAAENGIGFRTLRKIDLVQIGKEVVTECQPDASKTYYEVIQTRYQEAPANKGGYSFAYKQVEPGVVQVGVALCRADENFDRLEGKEQAIKHLQEGKFVTVPISSYPVFSEEGGDSSQYGSEHEQLKNVVRHYIANFTDLNKKPNI